METPSTPGGFVSETLFDPPADAVVNTMPPPEEPEAAAAEETEKKRGRPPLPEDEKEKRAAERRARAFGNLFGNGKPDTETTASPRDAPPVGEAVPMGEAIPEEKTKPDRKAQRLQEKQAEGLAEFLLTQEYFLVGMILDRQEANPLAKIKFASGERMGQSDFVNPMGPELHAQLKTALVVWLMTMEITEAPPWLFVLMSQITYLGVVMSQPKSRAKVVPIASKLKDLAKSGWNWIFGEKAKTSGVSSK